jgi:predicted aspartyl protease
MRIVKDIEIEGRNVKALFDTGSLHTYVKRCFLEGVPIRLLSEPYRVALGGKIIEVKEYCAVEGRIDGYAFDTKVVPIDELGRVDGNEIDVLIGALTMEEWEISVNPTDGSLDLGGLKRREFTEFLELEYIW